MLDRAALTVERTRASLADLRRWRDRLAAELAQLPDTLERLRLGAADFQVVGKRLRDSSAALEEITAWYTSTLGDSVRRSTEAADAVRTQLAHIPPSPAADAMTAAVAELQRTVRAMSSLNPWLPRTERRPD